MSLRGIRDSRPSGLRTAPKLRRAVFLDKDGTLVVDVPYNVDPERLRFTPNAFDGLRLLQGAGFALVVVTNQPGIALQRFTRQAFARLEAALFARLADEGIHLEGLHLCPHSPEPRAAGTCLCRKPAPGLFRQAAIMHRLDLTRSWMVGDILDDIEAGHRAGCRSVLLDVGNETVWRRSPLREPDRRAADLLEAARLIVDADAHDAGADVAAGTEAAERLPEAALPVLAAGAAGGAPGPCTCAP